MRILGIDPGTGRTGFGIIDVAKQQPAGILASGPTKSSDALVTKPLKEVVAASLVTFGCIETPKEDAMPLRLVQIRKAIQNLITSYSPDVISIELLFFGVNSRTAMTVGQARGVVIETIAEYTLPIYEYQGLSVKRIISGSGKADKKAVQELMRAFFDLEVVPKPDDAADGLAIALCHAISMADKS